MLLHTVAGLTSKEISSAVRLSPVSVRVRLHRAKLELRKAFTGSAQSAHKSRRRDRKHGRKFGPC